MYTLGRAAAALAAGDAAAVGQLMTEAQAAFDRHAAPFCAEQLRAPRLHALLSWPKLQPLIYGAKGVGSQGDGTAQLVCRSAATRPRRRRGALMLWRPVPLRTTKIPNCRMRTPPRF